MNKPPPSGRSNFVSTYLPQLPYIVIEQNRLVSPLRGRVAKRPESPCAISMPPWRRFVPMGEAMMALVLADHWLRWRAQYGDPSRFDEKSKKDGEKSYIRGRDA